MRKLTLVTGLAALALSACMQADAPEEAAPAGNTGEAAIMGLVGKTLSNEDGAAILMRDGRIRGSFGGHAFEGNWSVVNDQYCRSGTHAGRDIGYQCQDVVVNGDQVTFIRPDGSEQTYTIS